MRQESEVFVLWAKVVRFDVEISFCGTIGARYNSEMSTGTFCWLNNIRGWATSVRQAARNIINGRFN